MRAGFAKKEIKNLSDFICQSRLSVFLVRVSGCAVSGRDCLYEVGCFFLEARTKIARRKNWECGFFHFFDGYVCSVSFQIDKDSAIPVLSMLCVADRDNFEQKMEKKGFPASHLYDAQKAHLEYLFTLTWMMLTKTVPKENGVTISLKRLDAEECNRTIEEMFFCPFRFSEKSPEIEAFLKSSFCKQKFLSRRGVLSKKNMENI